jgi:hypothetical protein
MRGKVMFPSEANLFGKAGPFLGSRMSRPCSSFNNTHLYLGTELGNSFVIYYFYCRGNAHPLFEQR